MTTLREAAQQALEALENPWSAGPYGVAGAITALRAALAEPVQEPDDEVCDGLRGGMCIHQDPNQCKPEIDCPAFSAPPQRKPLTEEEISNIWDGHVVPVFGKNGINPIVFARAIERAHNIKE